MIEVSNLTKRFGATTAVDDLSFSVDRHEIVGFLGPNGAGKTTTMRILSGYLGATGGKVEIAGFDVACDSLEVRKRIGYLPESIPLYQEMRVSEYLCYRGRLKGVRGRRLRERLSTVLACCELEEENRTVIGRLSRGFRQRVGLADSLIHEPEVLILDEPTIGLDPNQIRNIRGLIKNLAQRHTVLLSSHILHEIEMLCERVLIIDHGHIAASGTTQNLIGLLKGNVRIVVQVQGPRDAVLKALQNAPGVEHVSYESTGDWHQVTCESQNGRCLREKVFQLVVEKGWQLRELRIEHQNLEDVFFALTKEGLDATTGEAKA